MNDKCSMKIGSKCLVYNGHQLKVNSRLYLAIPGSSPISTEANRWDTELKQQPSIASINVDANRAMKLAVSESGPLGLQVGKVSARLAILVAILH